MGHKIHYLVSKFISVLILTVIHLFCLESPVLQKDSIQECFRMTGICCISSKPDSDKSSHRHYLLILQGNRFAALPSPSVFFVLFNDTKRLQPFASILIGHFSLYKNDNKTRPCSILSCLLPAYLHHSHFHFQLQHAYKFCYVVFVSSLLLLFYPLMGSVSNRIMRYMTSIGLWREEGSYLLFSFFLHFYLSRNLFVLSPGFGAGF